MPLPTIFASLNPPSATFAQLDGNFTALGNLIVLPCTISHAVVAGADVYTLTSTANTPTPTAYADKMVFVGSIPSGGANTTVVVKANVNSIGDMPVKKDAPGGPVALAIGDISGGNLMVLVYDALLVGGAGFHILSPPETAALFDSVVTGGLEASSYVQVGTGTPSAVVLSPTILTGSVAPALGATAPNTIVTSTAPAQWVQTTVVVSGAPTIGYMPIWV